MKKRYNIIAKIKRSLATQNTALQAWRQRSHSLQAPLLAHPQEWIFFFILLLCLLCFSLTIEHGKFLAFQNSGYKQGISSVEASVLRQYTKTSSKGIYTVLKLKSTDGVIFYTTTKEDIKDLTHQKVRVTLINKSIRFQDYLSRFYAVNIKLELLPHTPSLKDEIRRFIINQHDSPLASNLYQTLFLADELNPIWRNNINALGIAHLLAISGFHYGVIVALMFGICYPPYYALQKRFFPYRNAYFDLSMLSLLIGIGYLLLLENSPSFLRAFAMALWGFCLLFSGISIASITSLFLLVMLLLAIFPTLITSIGFLFSVCGVFYILLFMKYFNLKQSINIFYLQCGIYFYMLPIVHIFFSPFSPLSLSSIILTPLFAFFYPFSIILHLINQGHFLDEYLDNFLNIQLSITHIHTPMPFVCLFVCLSLGAIYHKRLFWILNLLCFAFFVYLLVIFLKQ